MHYNLITEPFVSVQFIDGHEELLNLKDVLVKAHQIKTLTYYYHVKIELYAMYRFLVHLVMDIYRPSDEEDIYSIYDMGQFDPAKIDKYFHTYFDRFDLFDEKHPFMQTPLEQFSKVQTTKKSEIPAPVSMDMMSPLIRQGNNDIFFDPKDHFASEYRWNPTHTVYNLLFNNMCHVRNGSGWKAPVFGKSGTTPIFVLHEADNLLTTLLIEMDAVRDNDIPYWRRNNYGELYERVSLMNYEFYPVIKMLLNAQDFTDNQFHSIYIQADNKHPVFDRPDLNTFKTYLQLQSPGTIERLNSKQEAYAEAADTTRKCWFGLGVLLKNNTFNELTRPVVDVMKDEKTLPEKINISFFGFHKGKPEKGPSCNLYESIKDIRSDFIFDAGKQEEADKFLTFIESAGRFLQWKSMDYARAVLNLPPEKTVPRLYLDIRDVFFRDAKNMFFAEFVENPVPDIDECFKHMTKLCIETFDSLPVIRGNHLIKRTHKLQLMGLLKKAKEDIDGSSNRNNKSNSSTKRSKTNKQKG